MRATLILFLLIAGIAVALWLFTPTKTRQPEKQQQGTNTEVPLEVTTSSTELESGLDTKKESDTKTETGRPIAVPDFSLLEKGDNIDLVIPHENRRYHGTVEDIVVSKAGNKSLIGKLDVSGTGYRFVLTLGRQYTFGTVHTPEGRYKFESVGGQGRIVSVNEINADRDFNRPDYVMPSHHGDNT